MLFDDIIINILIVLFAYLIIYCIYYAITVFFATKKNQIGIEHKFYAQDLPSNLIVIVYADSADSSILNLVQSLKNQNYPAENYNVHVLFDNVNDDIIDNVDNIGGIKVWRINKGVKMGKDEALSWFLEKLISFRNVNAFVFLDSNRLVKSDFLSEVNKALFSSSVVVAAKEYIVSSNDMMTAVKNSVIKYCNRIFNTTRAVLKLIMPIDSGAVAIKQEVLELVKCVDFEDKKSEYIYSLYLASKGYVPTFAPNVINKVEYKNEDKLSLKDKFSILKYGFSNYLSAGIKIPEFLLSFLKPSALLIIFLYIVFFTFLYNFEVKNMFFYDSKYIALGAVLTGVIYIFSLLVSIDAKINPVFLLLNPVYSILEKIFPEKKEVEIKQEITNEIDIRGVGEAVKVSDGNDILNCTIEIKNMGDGKKAIFRYKDKKLESNTYQIPQEAIKEIADKLKTGGLTLLICSNCSHFGFKPNADLTKQNGACSCVEKMTEDIQPDTTLLNSCECFQAISDLNNIVDFPKDNNQ